MVKTNLQFLERRGYEVVRCLDLEDERYRLLRGEEIILDDSACEDYYGDKESVAGIFAEYVKDKVLSEELRVESALSVSDNGMGYTVINSITLKDHAKLMTFVSNNGVAKSSAVIYDDGMIFVTDDWQGDYAERLEEIEEYDWHSLDGRRAVIIDGLPRIL